MRRIGEHFLYSSGPSGPTNLDDIGQERLALIGHICLMWNYVDLAIDAILSVALELHPNMWSEVTSRINGFDGKIALLKASLEEIHQLNESDREGIAVTLNGLEHHKRYRDSVVHARILNPQATFAPTFEKRGKTYDVLITTTALQRLHDILDFLLAETGTLIGAVHYLSCVRGKNWEYRHDGKVDDRPTADERLEAGEEFRASMVLLRDFQRQRASLPPLPKFPEELLTRKELEELQALMDSYQPSDDQPR